MSAKGLAGAVKLVSRTFLEQRHYRDLFKILSDQWSHCHSLTAAVKLMEGHGVHLTPEEEERLASLSEDRMIDALVMKMPQQSRESFEHFFLQLSLIASTTSRLRGAFETGDAALIEEVLDSAENVGILQFILKMAVAQAGQEATTHQTQHEEWLARVCDKMSKCLQGQSQAMISQKALNHAKAQLGQCRVQASEKTKQFLLTMVAGQETALRNTVFISWVDFIQMMKKENEIRKDYEVEIEAAERRLKEYIEKQVGLTRNIIDKKHGQGLEFLMQECFNALKSEVETAKYNKMSEEELAELNKQMEKFSSDQKAKGRSALAGMTANKELACQNVCFQSWVAFLEDYRKNKEIEDAVKAKEKQINDIMKKQKEGSKSVVDRMAQGNANALVQKCLQGWIELFIEQKKSMAMQDKLNSGTGRFNEFSNRNKSSAHSAMDRTAFLQTQSTEIAVFSYWKKYVKVERMIRYARQKNETKKKQLAGVKGLFKNFASELESGLKDVTPRVDKKSRQAGA
mmetsp:Transcript_16886/g.31472  ORF Transcript_16886/g.31472 Transcript_16886/m.31472 type:complete len:514 (+) Transcript_16886:107-1648(+)